MKTIVTLLLLLPHAALAADAALELRIKTLEAEVSARPDDVDARLNLALALSWAGDVTASRTQAFEVLARSPKYWEAHLLIARLDAWKGRYEPAKERIRLVLASEPNHREAKLQLADVELWSGELDRSKDQLVELLAQDKNPELYVRLATVELQRMHSFASWQLVEEALALDPTMEKAIQLRDQIRLMSLDLAGTIETLPGDELGHSELVELTFLPRSFLGVALSDEFKRRFRTNNNRVMLRVEWRLDKIAEFDVSGAFGAPARVIPELTGAVRFYREIMSHLDSAATYTIDRLPIDATLHRFRLDAGVRVIDVLRAEGSYTLVLYDDAEPGVEVVHAALFRGCYQHPRVLGCLAFGVGSELIDQIVFDPTGSPATLTSRNFAIELRSEVVHNVELRLSTELSYRSNATEIFSATFGARTWF